MIGQELFTNSTIGGGWAEQMKLSYCEGDMQVFTMFEVLKTYRIRQPNKFLLEVNQPRCDWPDRPKTS